MFKIAALRSIDQSGLIYVNYAVAAAVGFLITGAEVIPLFSRPLLLGLAGGLGILFITGFFAMGKATEVAGVALTLSSWRMSVIIPFLASWVIWGEDPTIAQFIGLFVAVAAFLLISNPMAAGSKQSGQAVLLLGVVFLLGGVVDTLFKMMNESFALGNDLMAVSFLIFGAAVLLMTIPIGVKKMRTGTSGVKSALFIGSMLGLLNLGSVVFLLTSLHSLPGTIVFPVNNVSIVVGASILGSLVWKEGISKMAWGGVFLALVALVLLTAGA